jgi:hypothetical protein
MRNYIGKTIFHKIEIIRHIVFYITIMVVFGILYRATGDIFSSKSSSTNSFNITRVIRQSREYLVNHTGDDGMFEYRVNMNPEVKVKRKYNILRHAGTIYAMAMYYNLHPDPELKNAIKRAAGYLRDDAIGTLPGNEEMLAIWSKPEVNRNSSILQAKLGGTGLGLVALISVEKIHPEFTSLEVLRKLGSFIVYMQREDGSFYSKYIPSQGGRKDNWLSLYYPGEAALGLLMLYEKDRSDAWLEAACKALTYLADERGGMKSVPADHWALLATSKLFSLHKNGTLPFSRELMVNHTIQICESILSEQVLNSELPERMGGFSNDGRTTPTATRLEGLQAARMILPDDLEICNRIDIAVNHGIRFLLNAHISDGQFAGGIPRSTGKLKGKSSRIKDFNRRSTEIRIDYVQHAMCSMMQYIKK